MFRSRLPPYSGSSGCRQDAAYQARRGVPRNYADNYRIRARAGNDAVLVRYFYFYFCYDLRVYFVLRAVVRYRRQRHREAAGAGERAGRVYRRVRAGNCRAGKVPYFDHLCVNGDVVTVAPVDHRPVAHELERAGTDVNRGAVYISSRRCCSSRRQVKNTAYRHDERVARYALGAGCRWAA